MPGHEISKEHIAFKQNARRDSDFNIKSSISLYWAQYKRKKQNEKKNKTKQKETVHILKVKTKVEILYLKKTEHLQDTSYFVPHMSLKKFTLPLLLFP